MTISAARINLVTHSLFVIQKFSQGYYTSILSRVYISVLKHQTVIICSHNIITQLLTLNGLPKSMRVKYLCDTVHCFVSRVCKRCYNSPFYYTGVVYNLDHNIY